MQPRRNRLRATDRASPASQQQKRRLKRIFGRVWVSQPVTAYAQHHAAVPFDQQPKRFFRMIAKVGSHQVAVGQA
jgi:hypothetical protein